MKPEDVRVGQRIGIRTNYHAKGPRESFVVRAIGLVTNVSADWEMAWLSNDGAGFFLQNGREFTVDIQLYDEVVDPRLEVVDAALKGQYGTTGPTHDGHRLASAKAILAALDAMETS